ncbi:aminomethyltransferase [Rhodosalinus halophilus]|uniref:Aminomethyltransferase n=1 Tax=Rhodosalinus halophilus TaxID=2259333 RepID=A0A365U550_9RHOB|nr:urea carboxylase-associated family protein [Rhodosalinus halophilus]RBI83326.1 aminomethyltransferase [Rhodosalinus halophilus]
MSETSERATIPARKGRAVRLSAGQAIEIVNTHGTQVVDTWAFNAEDLTEFLSNEHMRATLGRLWPAEGDALITNRRRPILVMERDTSPGRHDTLIAACDDYRYGLLGCTEYHDNCTDNLFAAMRSIGLRIDDCPSPLNLWMNIPVAPDGSTGWGEPLSRPGDIVVLRAQMDCVVAMSACPQDILPINGAARAPTEAHYRVLPVEA